MARYNSTNCIVCANVHFVRGHIRWYVILPYNRQKNIENRERKTHVNARPVDVSRLNRWWSCSLRHANHDPGDLFSVVYLPRPGRCSHLVVVITTSCWSSGSALARFTDSVRTPGLRIFQTEKGLEPNRAQVFHRSRAPSVVVDPAPRNGKPVVEHQTRLVYVSDHRENGMIRETKIKRYDTFTSPAK